MQTGTFTFKYKDYTHTHDLKSELDEIDQMTRTLKEGQSSSGKFTAISKFLPQDMDQSQSISKTNLSRTTLQVYKKKNFKTHDHQIYSNEIIMDTNNLQSPPVEQKRDKYLAQLPIIKVQKPVYNKE